jgi:predicted Zn-dependent protease
VTAVSPEQDAVILLTVAEQTDPSAAAREFLSQEGVRGGQVRSGRVNDLPAAWGGFSAQAQDMNLVGRVVFIRYRDATFRVLGYGMEGAWKGKVSAVEGTLGSFRRLTDPRALAVQPARLSLVRTDSGMAFEEFASRYPSSVETGTLAIINQLSPGQQVPPGSLMKRVVGGPN